MKNRIFAVAALALSLSACVSSGAATRAPAGSVPKQIPMQNTEGLEEVMGQGARGLARMFGEPRLDVREGDARKLQFSSRDCVLDTYLYPKGRGEAVVTYVDARTPDGRNADRASCAAALRR